MNYRLVPRFKYTLPLFSYLIPAKYKASTDTINEVFGSASHIYSVNSARVGLRILLSSISSHPLKIGVQVFTCHTVFQAIHNAGHTPVFIDLTNELKLDINDLKQKICNIDVLIITHSFGFPDDFDILQDIAKDKTIIEDCSHSFLSKYKDRYTGVLGDASIFSTGLAKFPPIGSGGFCIVNNYKKFPVLKQEYVKIPKAGFLSSFRNHIKVFLFTFILTPPLYGILTYRIGKRLDSKIDFINKFTFSEHKGYLWTQRYFRRKYNLFNTLICKQRENAELLISLLKRKSILPADRDSVTANYYIFPLLTSDRDNLYENLLKNNIEAGKHFHKSIGWATDFGYIKGECPNTEKIVNQILTVPVYFGVSKNTIHMIAKIINEKVDE